MTGRCVRNARPSYGKLGREADRQAELARVFELGADAGTRDTSGRGARPGRPLGRSRGPCWLDAAGQVRSAASWRRPGALPASRRVTAPATARRARRSWPAREPDPTVVWNALSAASLFALGAEGLDDYQLPIEWLEKPAVRQSRADDPMYRRTVSRTRWAACCCGRAGSTRRSPA